MDKELKKTIAKYAAAAAIGAAAAGGAVGTLKEVQAPEKQIIEVQVPVAAPASGPATYDPRIY